MAINSISHRITMQKDSPAFCRAPTSTGEGRVRSEALPAEFDDDSRKKAQFLHEIAFGDRAPHDTRSIVPTAPRDTGEEETRVAAVQTA
jgi:hypothetical protein